MKRRFSFFLNTRRSIQSNCRTHYRGITGLVDASLKVAGTGWRLKLWSQRRLKAMRLQIFTRQNAPQQGCDFPLPNWKLN